MLWINNFSRIVNEQACVLVTMILVSGSAPRESGARMVVARDFVDGSIGGGNLEYQAISRARELLETGDDGSQHKVLYGLGPELNQCCGGAVALYYEVFSGGAPQWLSELERMLQTDDCAVLASALDGSESQKVCLKAGEKNRVEFPHQVPDSVQDWIFKLRDQPDPAGIQMESDQGSWWLELIRESSRPVFLFGAGHVGHAVANVLAPLPFRVTWVDSREAAFPVDTPIETRVVHSLSPADCVADAAPDTIFIVMTHSHQLDEDICFEVLERDTFAWLGLIGSATKRRRFIHRLEKRGIPPARLDKLVCPVGLAGIRGKQPATIALSLAAQLMTDQSGY